MLVPLVYAIAEHVALNNMLCLAQQLVLNDDFVGDGRAVLSFHGSPGHKSSLGVQVGGPGPFGGGPGDFLAPLGPGPPGIIPKLPPSQHGPG